MSFHSLQNLYNIKLTTAKIIIPDPQLFNPTYTSQSSLKKKKTSAKNLSKKNLLKLIATRKPRAKRERKTVILSISAKANFLITLLPPLPLREKPHAQRRGRGTRFDIETSCRASIGPSIFLSKDSVETSGSFLPPPVFP